MFCCGCGAVRDGLSAHAPPRSHPDLPRSRYPPPSRPAPKGAPSVVAPRVICPLRSLKLAPPRPPEGGSCVYPSCVRFFSRFLA